MIVMNKFKVADLSFFYNLIMDRQADIYIGTS